MVDKTDLGYIPMLQQAIRKAHGCETWHVKAEPVKETFQGKTVWEGVVEVFALVDHPKAKLCYAWAHAEGDVGQEVRVVTVLGLPPVDSPLKAVQVAVVADSKTRQHT